MDTQDFELMIRQDAEVQKVFVSTLDWLIAVTNRYYSPLEFGLVHISFGNQHDLGEAYGAVDAIWQLVKFTATFKRAFRKTDLVARIGIDYWIIVPYTPASEGIYEKVLGILKLAEHEGLQVVERKTSIFTLSTLLKKMDKKLTQLSTLEFLEHLKDNREKYAKHMFVLPSAPVSES
jgi:hypothetical protein